MRKLRSELETEREDKLQLRELFDKQATELTLTLTQTLPLIQALALTQKLFHEQATELTLTLTWP